jgi:hypothetical protein
MMWIVIVVGILCLIGFAIIFATWIMTGGAWQDYTSDPDLMDDEDRWKYYHPDE